MNQIADASTLYDQLGGPAASFYLGQQAASQDYTQSLADAYQRANTAKLEQDTSLARLTQPYDVEAKRLANQNTLANITAQELKNRIGLAGERDAIDSASMAAAGQKISALAGILQANPALSHGQFISDFVARNNIPDSSGLPALLNKLKPEQIMKLGEHLQTTYDDNRYQTKKHADSSEYTANRHYASVIASMNAKKEMAALKVSQVNNLNNLLSKGPAKDHVLALENLLLQTNRVEDPETYNRIATLLQSAKDRAAIDAAATIQAKEASTDRQIDRLRNPDKQQAPNQPPASIGGSGKISSGTVMGRDGKPVTFTVQ